MLFFNSFYYIYRSSLQLNLSQEQLANKCNLSRNAIYNYENNKRTPTVSALAAIAENLNISPADIFDHKGNTSNSLNVIESSKNLEIAELYKKYFLDLFNWKIVDMAPHDYFKFVLSLYPLNETKHMTEEDFNELSILFYKFLTLISIKRYSINKNEKNTPSAPKKMILISLYILIL